MELANLKHRLYVYYIAISHVSAAWYIFIFVNVSSWLHEENRAVSDRDI